MAKYQEGIKSSIFQKIVDFYQAKKIYFLIVEFIVFGLLTTFSFFSDNTELKVFLLVLFLPLTLSLIFELKQSIRINLILIGITFSIVLILGLIFLVSVLTGTADIMELIALVLGAFVFSSIWLIILVFCLPFVIELITSFIKAENIKLRLQRLSVVLAILCFIAIGHLYIRNNEYKNNTVYYNQWLQEAENNFRSIPTPNSTFYSDTYKTSNVEIYHPEQEDAIVRDLWNAWDSKLTSLNTSDPNWVNGPNWRNNIEEFIKEFNSNEIGNLNLTDRKLGEYKFVVLFKSQDVKTGEAFDEKNIKCNLKLYKGSKSKTVFGTTAAAEYPGTDGWRAELSIDASKLNSFNPDKAVLTVKGKGWSSKEEFTRDEINKLVFNWSESAKK